MVSARFEFRFGSLKSISVLILFVNRLMIGSSKNNREIIRENAFEHKKKKPLIGLRTTGPWVLQSGIGNLTIETGIQVPLTKNQESST